MDTLLSLDRWIFHLINSTLANPAFDVVMPFITNLGNIIPVLIALIVFALWQGSREDIVFVLLTVLALILADQTVGFLKSYFSRSRPCQELDMVRLLVDCGKGKSFPSGHGANNGAVAVAAIIVYGWQGARWWMLVATIICYSRVYVGVHYVSDVLGGMMWGGIIALTLGIVWRKIFASNSYLRLS
jgi:undecaprenyl-diphosphatase